MQKSHALEPFSVQTGWPHFALFCSWMICANQTMKGSFAWNNRSRSFSLPQQKIWLVSLTFPFSAESADRSG
ncbi:hypothetical protein EUGRSUZ_A01459 [Eucalyptus grandis]|uniref:Uncharacterized protein n=2 Tax=Eucalyptus grandis TaxID=71139 RepID=A0ACC3M2S0_EUCGR|nr:hypothetical protein EUGRSUZ_A01459 [Eucalyptus grandis]